MNDPKKKHSKEGNSMKRFIFLAIIVFIVALTIPAFAGQNQTIKENGYSLVPVDYTPVFPEDEYLELGEKHLKKKEFAKALKQFSKAARKGNTKAQYHAAKLYGEGDGTPQNFQYAYIWANISAANGYRPAKKYRDRMAKHLDSQQLAKAQAHSSRIQKQIYK